MLAFIAPFIQPVLNLLGGPVIKGAVDAYRAKLDAGNTKERIAADLAGRELLVQQRELEVQAQYKTAIIGHWYEPPTLMGYIMVTYIGKVIVWDKVLAWGVTDPIEGQVLTWAGMIMVFWIGSRGILNLANILKR